MPGSSGWSKPRNSKGLKFEVKKQVRHMAQKKHSKLSKKSTRKIIAPLIPIAETPKKKKIATETHSHERVTTDSLKLYFREISRVKLLTAEEEVLLAKGIEKGDLKAKQNLIAANLRLVIKVAKK